MVIQSIFFNLSGMIFVLCSSLAEASPAHLLCSNLAQISNIHGHYLQVVDNASGCEPFLLLLIGSDRARMVSGVLGNGSVCTHAGGDGALVLYQ